MIEITINSIVWDNYGHEVNKWYLLAMQNAI